MSEVNDERREQHTHSGHSRRSMVENALLITIRNPQHGRHFVDDQRRTSDRMRLGLRTKLALLAVLVGATLSTPAHSQNAIT